MKTRYLVWIMALVLPTQLWAETVVETRTDIYTSPAGSMDLYGRGQDASSVTGLGTTTGTALDERNTYRGRMGYDPALLHGEEGFYGRWDNAGGVIGLGTTTGTPGYDRYQTYRGTVTDPDALNGDVYGAWQDAGGVIGLGTTTGSTPAALGTDTRRYRFDWSTLW